MDGGNEDSKINLKKEMFWPDNILELFTKYEVRREFDLLSVDMDSYDWWILEKILEDGYRPRVIGIHMSYEQRFVSVDFLFSVTEYNSMMNFNESRAILPPEDNKSWKMWDKVSRYQVDAKNSNCLFAVSGQSQVCLSSVSGLKVQVPNPVSQQDPIWLLTK